MIKLAIVGGRDYTDYNNFHIIVNNYCNKLGKLPDYIISGGAKGIDTMAEIYANQYNIETIIYKADWNTFGKKAGILRNTDIISESTHVLALPTYNSIGTYDSINKAKKMNKQLTIIKI